MAQRLARELQAPLYASTITRLLVELNRSLGHPQLFSEFTRGLSTAEKQEIVRRYYDPHRQQVTEWLRQQSKGTCVVHVSVHSFTPQLNGERRNADVGLLYDPSRTYERIFCQQWQHRLRQQHVRWKVRRNYPYLGKADGFTTSLRRQFTNAQYLGIELEVNQRWVTEGGTMWRRLQVDVLQSLLQVASALQATNATPSSKRRPLAG